MSAAQHPIFNEQKMTSDIVLKERVDTELTPKMWEFLGPFPTGTREQDFGADPLEAYGGFANITFSETHTFPSELADNGTVGWSRINTNSDGSVGPIYFNNIRVPLGWAMNQFQMWARGYFELSPKVNDDSKTIPILIQCQPIGDFYVDDRRLFGDWYGYEKSWHVLHLRPGRHVVNVRAVYEIRAFGGGIPPALKFKCLMRRLRTDEMGVMMLDRTIVVPDLVGGRLAGKYINIALLNTHEKQWITVSKVYVVSSNVKITASIVEHRNNNVSNPGVRLAPSQQRNIRIQMKIDSPVFRGMTIFFKLQFVVSTKTEGHNTYWMITTDQITIRNKDFGEIYKFTFKDFDGTVQYGEKLWKAQDLSKSCRPKKCPILVALHGAGAEAEDNFWISAYKKQKNAWVLLPTGRTPWGYDWHGPSLRNIHAAIKTLATRLPGVPKHEKRTIIPDPKKLFVSGHSNGGQGAWFFISHFPDLVVAGTPVAGFSKIQNYVPYHWNGEAHVDPILRGILESSISEFNNDLYSSNLVGIPILARTGADDDNVPPVHSRMLIRLINEHSGNPHAANLSEVPDQGHWFEDAMNDDAMQRFLDEHLNISHDKEEKLPPSKKFTVSLLNPASFGSKGGIQIEQLVIPFRLGKLNVQMDVRENGQIKWNIKTSNIRRFRFVPSDKFMLVIKNVERIMIDGIEFDSNHFTSDGYFVKSKNHTWKFDSNTKWLHKERHPLTYGPAHQILESSQPLIIVIGTKHKSQNNGSRFLEIAQEIAHSWYLYGRGDSEIFYDEEILIEGNKIGGRMRGNLVLLGGPLENHITHLLLKERNSEVIFDKDGSFSLKHAKFSDPGIGILFLHPFKRSQLALIIAGTDVKGLDQVSKLFPKRTGVPVPDWIITGPEVAWKGIGGILGAGFWNNKWRFDDSIGYLA
ncbi:15329_t:CDS:10 [Acaulospora morrowiae]|uniref:15329_t:CDS:1 n=1 Tax=Acaulospora morrowiae TaxID=94023 RepID=A0A9N8WJB3_9GLOM|nr:15329_t:CDS:10 [Acaulospora morrowiae]